MATPARTSATAAATRGRRSYRHGDLRRALLDAGVALAREGGPDAVVLREATRRAGVVPNAAYRHFAGRQALLDAVRIVALDQLALAMEQQMAVAAQVAEPTARARCCAPSAWPTWVLPKASRACFAPRSPAPPRLRRR